jgi:hypothetical protein
LSILNQTGGNLFINKDGVLNYEILGGNYPFLQASNSSGSYVNIIFDVSRKVSVGTEIKSVSMSQARYIQY